jgi:hypothetical protein
VSSKWVTSFIAKGGLSGGTVMVMISTNLSRTAVLFCVALVPLASAVACVDDSTGTPVGVNDAGNGASSGEAGSSSGDGTSSGGASSGGASSGGSGAMDAGSRDGSAACNAATEKTCGGICVKKDDPAYGCTPDKCEACAEAPFVDEFKCETNSCKVKTCLPGKGDCDLLTVNGCEADITTAKNCGKCGNVCSAPTLLCGKPPSVADAGADAGPVGNQCFSECPTATPMKCTDTCTDLKSDVNNCGACDKACLGPAKYGSPTCAAGLCGVQCLKGLKFDGTECVTDAAACLAVGSASTTPTQCCSNNRVVSRASAPCVCNKVMGAQCKEDTDCCTGGAVNTCSKARGALIGTCK